MSVVPEEEEVVISGISGKFPQCENIDEFSAKLFAGVDMIPSDEEQNYNNYLKLPRTGFLNDDSKFDSQYFSIHGMQADVMDPQMRLLHELSYEAIIDSGYNPEQIRGSEIGVFVGHCGTENYNIWHKYADPDIFPFAATGHAASLYANRLSYAYDFKGTSLAVNSSWPSSTIALMEAFKSVKRGDCDGALVAGTRLCRAHSTSMAFLNIGMTSQHGISKPFDENANGYVRSEAIAVVFIQKKSLAKRHYATILNIDSNMCGTFKMNYMFPTANEHTKLLEKVYSEMGINPSTVEYLEADASGLKDADKEELITATEFFCKNRDSPLLVGTVKSNMGHSEPTSGLCSIIKVILAMEKRVIPPTINYEKPNIGVPALHDGRIKVTDKTIPYKGGIVALNNFGFGGPNVHVILKPNPKTVESKKQQSLPKIVTVSGRTEEAVKNFLDKVEQSDNDNLLHMVHDIHSNGNIRYHFHRGYSVFNTDEPLKEIMMYEDIIRSVWFIFPGMGTQWHGMGKDLMEFEIFRESVRKCSDVLEPYGINMYDIIKDGKEEIMDKEIFLTAITVIQIALVDLLFALNIKPDGIIGHSNGETAAAYADGALTMEQSVLCVYFKIRSIIEAKLPKGSMASIGLSWSEAEARCPPGVFVACDNCDDNVTVSGPPDIIQEFVKTMQAENIFAKEVPNSIEVAFHSKYIEDSVPAMTNYINKVISKPVKRSSRWISTSIPSSQWDGELAQTCSAEYYVNNSVSPVYFREALTHIPENAIVIEVSPHCLFQSILKRALPSSCVNIGLSKRLYPKNLEFFMYSIGKLYNLGLQPKIQVFYSKVEYPVPRGTPSLSPMVEWAHSKSWRTYTRADFQSAAGSSKFIFLIMPNRDKFHFLRGHVIDGHRLYPASGYLFLAWNAFSILKLKRIEECPVKFENVRFHRATLMEKKEIEIHADILFTSGDFELRESGELVASGRITYMHNTEPQITELPIDRISNGVVLTTNDIYKELRLRHYEYSGLFKGIISANVKDLTGELQWNDNWIAFIDTMLQFCVVGFLGVRKLCVPIGIERIRINPEAMKSLEKEAKVIVKANKYQRSVKVPGIEISGLNVHAVPTRDQSVAPLLLEYVFVPYENTTNMQSTTDFKKHCLNVILQIVLENCNTFEPCIVEVSGSKPAQYLLITELGTMCKNEPEYSVELNEIVNDAEEYSADETLKSLRVKIIARDNQDKLRNGDINLLVATDIIDSNEKQDFLSVAEFLKPGGFILLEESSETRITGFANNWQLVCHYLCGEKKLLLFRLCAEISDPVILYFTEKDYSWLKKLKLAIEENKDNERRIIIVNEGEKYSGVLGLANCLKKEFRDNKIRCFFIRDGTAPMFSLSDPFYSTQLKKDLLMNVNHNNSWGGHYFLKIKESSVKEQKYAHVGIKTVGNLNTLTWIQSPVPTSSNICYVYYSALNFKDIMLASGKLSLIEETRVKGLPLGHEFSGCDINGQRIFGIVENFGMSTAVVTNPRALLKVPSHWTLEEAATVPVVYLTAYYALIIRGNMKEGQTILIHAGCGGVGLAAITIALHRGVTVYTTVGSQEKRDFLKERFPQLTDKNIANSRDTSFELHVMKETQGRGVDLVLNCLSEEKLQASVRCLRKNGKFLEIGKYDLAVNTFLGMSMFNKNISFHGVALDELMTEEEDFANVVRLLEQEIESGVVQPLPTTVFSEDQVSEAFKFLASAKHIGKVLLKIRDQESDIHAKLIKKTVCASSRIYFNPEKVYIIIGGLGGLGMELADWFVLRGAKNLVLTSRKGIKDGYQASRIKLWESMDVNVVISTTDCTEENGAEQLIVEANKCGDVAGIFNLAVILKDDLLNNLTEEDFELACKPKVNITKHLDIVSRKLCPNLEYFVLFSSVVSGRGNSEQCNYGLANSAAEMICESRREDNLPAVAIQWGVVGDVGIVAEMTERKDIDIAGMIPQSISSCLSVLDTLLTQTTTIVSSVVVADKINKMSFKDADILEIIGDTMGIPNIKEMNPNTTLAQLGADSFMVTAIKQTLEKEYNKVLSTDEIRNLTLGQIKEFSEKKGGDKVKILDVLQQGLEKTTDADNDVLPTHIPTEALVKLPSSNNSTNSNVNVFFIHPSQGVVKMLEPLASLLPANVWGLQFKQDTPCESLQDLAAHYIQYIKSIQPSGSYIISSYSFGASLSFEICLQLEKAGETVTFVMLDGSVQVNMLFDAIQSAPSLKDKLTDEIVSLVMFLYLCGYEKALETYNYLLSFKTLEERVLSVARIVSKDLNLPEDQVIVAAKLYHQRFVVNELYKPTSKLSGKLILIKSNHFKNNPNIEKDYRFNELCLQEVIIHEVDDTHYGIIKNEESLKIIQDIFQAIIE